MSKFLEGLEAAAGQKVTERGKSYFRNHKILEQEIREIEDEYIPNLHVIGARVEGSYYQTYITKIIFNEEEVINAECNCDYSITNRRVCKHMIAVAIAAEKYMIQKKREDAAAVAPDFHLDFFKNDESKNKELIFLNVTPNIKNLSGHIDFSLDIEIVGRSKKYKINSKMNKFLMAYEEESFTFGKAYTYEPKRDYFQGWDKKFIEILREYSAIFTNQYYGDLKLEYILSNPYSFDKMIDLLGEGGKLDLRKVGLSELLNVDISKNEGKDIALEFKNLNKLLRRGKTTFIEFDVSGTPIFYRLSSEDVNLYKKLSQKTARSSKMVISQKNLPLVINSVQKMAKVTIAKNLETHIYTPEKIEDKIYIDSYNTYGLRVYSKRFFDGEPEESLENKVVMSSALEVSNLYKEILEKYKNNFENGAYHITDVESIYSFVIDAIPELEKQYQIYYSEAFKAKSFMSASYKIESKVKDLLEIKFSIAGIEKEEIYNFLNAVREKKKYYLLKNGGILSIADDEELDKLNDVLDISEASRKEIEAGLISRTKNYSYFLASTLKKIKDVVLDENFVAMDRELREISTLDDEKKIMSLFPMLREYQLHGVCWLNTLKKLGLGGILADDMGLGKTLQTIAYLAIEKRELPTLIVAPKSLVYNWKSEFQRFAPHLEVKMCIGTKSERESMIKNLKSGDVLITTYGVLKNDIELYAEIPFEDGFANIIIDEAQNIKNMLGKTAAAIKGIRGETKIALTGTPIENNILELWSIFDFAFPGYLGKHTTFKKRYLDNLKSLKSVVGPFILRRMKGEVLKELPDKIEQDVIVELDSAQKKVYLAYLEKYKRELEADGQDAIKILGYLTRLRQICNHPKLFLEDYKGESAKVDALLELLEEAKSGGHRVLLFSQFTEMLGLIKESLEGKFDYLYLDGKTDVKERVNLVDRFNSGEGDLFIISLKAGGSGLNLTGADTVIHFDPWWNPSVENQATDRAHRMGQKSVVNVFRLITKGTIEEKINLIKGEKSKVISEVLDGKTSDIMKMNRDELLNLF
ncbi:SNF2-related protein [Cetobacterium sp.]|uniref:SNF2-related protein n=1 Tax=Cetobacterium sp. TaxID=2071632 RepID=UPI003F320F05